MTISIVRWPVIKMISAGCAPHSTLDGVLAQAVSTVASIPSEHEHAPDQHLQALGLEAVAALAAQDVLAPAQ
jgi:hypothetical protein